MIQDNVENRRRSIKRTFRKAEVKTAIGKITASGKKRKPRAIRSVEIYINGKKVFGRGEVKHHAKAHEEEKTMGDDN